MAGLREEIERLEVRKAEIDSQIEASVGSLLRERDALDAGIRSMKQVLGEPMAPALYAPQDRVIEATVVEETAPPPAVQRETEDPLAPADPVGRVSPTVKGGGERIRTGAFKRIPREKTTRMVLGEMLKHGWVTADTITTTIIGGGAELGEPHRYWRNSINTTLLDLFREGRLVRDAAYDMPGRSMHKYQLKDEHQTWAQNRTQDDESMKEIKRSTRKAIRQQKIDDGEGEDQPEAKVVSGLRPTTTTPPTPAKRKKDDRPLHIRSVPEKITNQMLHFIQDKEPGMIVYQKDFLKKNKGTASFHAAIMFSQLEHFGAVVRGEKDRSRGGLVPFTLTEKINDWIDHQTDPKNNIK